ncbi:uncharacterized protein [Dermacentor albipictus]|uniref:uncharacterized protein n=1 Tax=Dermacentor albipictus TaxID=60249 RepID=UPI0038FD1374
MVRGSAKPKHMKTVRRAVAKRTIIIIDTNLAAPAVVPQKAWRESVARGPWREQCARFGGRRKAASSLGVWPIGAIAGRANTPHLKQHCRPLGGYLAPLFRWALVQEGWRSGTGALERSGERPRGYPASCGRDPETAAGYLSPARRSDPAVQPGCPTQPTVPAVRPSCPIRPFYTAVQNAGRPCCPTSLVTAVRPRWPASVQRGLRHDNPVQAPLPAQESAVLAGPSTVPLSTTETTPHAVPTPARLEASDAAALIDTPQQLRPARGRTAAIERALAPEGAARLKALQKDEERKAELHSVEMRLRRQQLIQQRQRHRMDEKRKQKLHQIEVRLRQQQLEQQKWRDDMERQMLFLELEAKKQQLS